MRARVNAQIAGLGECLVADVAFVGFYAHVTAHVEVEGTARVEGLVALRTAERSLAGVRSDVRGQETVGVEAAIAVWAFVVLAGGSLAGSELIEWFRCFDGREWLDGFLGRTFRLGRV